MRSIPAASFYLLSLIVAGKFSLGLAAEAETVTLGLTTRTGSNSLPYVIAEEKGFFKGEGLNAVVVIMQNQVVVNGVLTRNVDYGGTFSNFMGGALSGLPLRIVMAAMDGSDHVLVTTPEIKKVEDLKGKIIGISSFGGAPHSEALMILRKHGLNPDRDVTFMQIGGSSSRYAALESNTIHAAMLVPPFNKIGRKMRGFNELVAINDVVKVPFGGLAVHVDKIREKPHEIVKMIKAVLKSIEFIWERKSEILSFMERSWGIKDPEVREEIYRDIVVLYSRTGIAPDELMKNLMQMIQEARKGTVNVPLSNVVDWSFARKANEELKRR
ncbi:MAG: ABC transporter substrate-binding protein [Deltaproteobacteria bacterium]|nr:ABC transporter substrate-binding protein [Deltaproteobacteria bacterium]